MQPLIHPARYKGVHGGRGSGKSHFFAESLIAISAITKIDWVCVREVQKSLAQSVKKLLESKIETLGLGPLFDVKENMIRSQKGGLIVFQGMQNHTAESIKSLEDFDGAWVEESQTLSQRSLDLLRPTIRKKDSEIWFSWNPRFATDPIDVLLRGAHPPPDSIVVEANYCDNPWFPAVLKAEMEYDFKRDTDKYLHVWRGQYLKNSESRVFKNWVVEEFDRPKGTIFRFGADWGFANDPTVLIRCSLEGNRLYVDYEAWMIGCEIVNTPDLFRRLPESEKWFITADSARPETIDYMRSNGFPRINAAKKGAGSVDDGVEFLKSFDIVVHPRCKHTIKELEMYSYKTDPLTGAIIPILADKHNHTIDALRYSCEGVRHAHPEYHGTVVHSYGDRLIGL
jgi:phage terminase large subunit